MHDRHRRPSRGMLAPPNTLTGQMLRARRPQLPTPFFFQCVTDAIDEIVDAAPEALDHVDIDVDEVPDSDDLWGTHIPLAAATPADTTRTARIVMYRRPIELRSADRDDLHQLVYVTLLEQVSAVTGLTQATLDPKNLRED